ncbi:MAG: potassium channel family protein [Oscillospiraceae bacterium]|nr:potassium channel family protein [Oscillospiraceae bacterium]
MKKRYVWIVGLIAVYLLLVWLLYAIEGRQPALMPEESPSVNILSFTDALWYSLTTISTVGYGDKVPASA